MCFDRDSLPPIPVLSGAAVSHDDLVLEARDGNRFAAFSATPDEPSGAGIVILPDVRGLYRFYEELALRFAERGHAAIAFDYFGRTAGRREAGRRLRVHAARPADDRRRACRRTSPLRLRGSARTGRRRSSPSASASAAGNSWLAAAGGHGLAGAIGFYGRPGPGRDGSAGPTQRAAELKAPILALMGGADEGIPVEDVQAFERALEEAGVEHEIVIYDGAPHSFFDRKFEQFADASEDAWQRVLAFVAQHSGSKR